MKMRTSGLIISGVIIIVAGVLLCILNREPDILQTIVRIVGGAFLLAGVINIGMMLMRRGGHQQANVMMRFATWFTGICGVCLGFAMLVATASFTPVLVYFFGALLVVGGLVVTALMSWGFKPYTPSGWVYVLPVLDIVAGSVMIFSEGLRSNDSLLVLITGLGFILSGFAIFLSILGAARAKASEKAAEKERLRKAHEQPEPVAGHEIPVEKAVEKPDEKPAGTAG